MAEHIQIGDVGPRIQYAADGEQTEFTYPFPIFVATDLEVYLGGLLQEAGYAVSGAGLSTGGNCIFDTAPADGTAVTLRRRLAIARTSDFQESGDFRAKVINDELDRLVAMVQQVADDAKRALKLAPTDGDAEFILPAKGDRKGKVLTFDAETGEPAAQSTDSFAGPQGPKGDPGDMSGANNLSELTNPAAARTALGLGTAATQASSAFEAADTDILKADETKTIGVGYPTTPHDYGTVAAAGTVTVDLREGVQAIYTNGGAHTLAPDATRAGYQDIVMTNNASAGAVTTAGWTVLGDSLTETDGDAFLLSVRQYAARDILIVVALQ